MMKNFWFSAKKHHDGDSEDNFSKKTYDLLRILKVFAAYSEFQKIQGFSKKLSIFSKYTKFVLYEKYYYFSRIPQQMCCNLLIKITFRNVNKHCERNWQTSGKKTHLLKVLLTCFISTVQNNNCSIGLFDSKPDRAIERKWSCQVMHFLPILLSFERTLLQNHQLLSFLQGLRG